MSYATLSTTTQQSSRLSAAPPLLAASSARQGSVNIISIGRRRRRVAADYVRGGPPQPVGPRASATNFTSNSRNSVGDIEAMSSLSNDATEMVM